MVAVNFDPEKDSLVVVSSPALNCFAAAAKAPPPRGEVEARGEVAILLLFFSYSLQQRPHSVSGYPHHQTSQDIQNQNLGSFVHQTLFVCLLVSGR
jgi:hypothetical protein